MFIYIGESCLSSSSIERKCSGGSDPGSSSQTSGATIPISQFHHHNIYSGTSPVDDIIDPLGQKEIKSDLHHRFFCNNKQCNSANELPERHVSGGFTAPPSRQISDGTSPASTTATTPSCGSIQAPDTPPVSTISTPSSNSVATSYAMTTDNPGNLVKTAAYSDELLLREQQQQRLQCSVTFADNIPKSPEQTKGGKYDVDSLTNGNNTTAVSFECNGISRTRHTSVPQTARSTTTGNTHSIHGLTSEGYDESAFRARQMAVQHHASLLSESDRNHTTIHGTTLTNHRSSRVQIEGSKLSLRLSKSQIDNAAKSKKKVYQDNFSVTLFLVKPKDQSSNLKDLNYEDVDSQGNKIPISDQHEMLNSHPRLAPSGSAASVTSTEINKSGASLTSKQNHLETRHLTSKHLRFGKGFGLKVGTSSLEPNSSQESSSEDDMGSAEIGRCTNEDRTTKGILRKSGSSCSSTRVVAVSKTKVSEPEGKQELNTNCSHQLMTSASEVMHSNTQCRNDADILQIRRTSVEKTVPPTDNADTSITGTNTATLASVTSDFVVVTLSDLAGSAASHTSNANSFPREIDPKSVATSSTTVLHHQSHHSISAGPTPVSTITVSNSTWI